MKFLGIIFLVSFSIIASSQDKVYAPSIVPPDYFVSQFDSLLDLQLEIQKLQSDLMKDKKYREMMNKSDQLRGMGQRIASQIPKGYSFDRKSKLFVLLPLSKQPQVNEKK